MPRARSTAALVAVALVARVATTAGAALASSCAPPRFSCASARATVDDASKCHASFQCRIVCSPSASCVETFTIRAGEATLPTGETVTFNASTRERSALGPTTYGGDAACSAVGCDAYATRLTTQNAALTERYDGKFCEVRETSERCALEGAPKDGSWTEFTVTMKCRNKILPCGARAVAEIDFLGVVESVAPGAPSPPTPPDAPPMPPKPPPPPPPPSTFAKGGAGRAALRAALVVALSAVVAYAALGGAYVWALERGWVEGIAEPCWERDGAFCELLWCWCAPAYWRASDEECLAAYEGRAAAETATREDVAQTTAPLLGNASSDDDDDDA